jgi:hypothetical protein
VLFVADDWVEDHHDVELVGDEGRLLARRQLPEGIEGIARLHALVADQMPEEWAELEAGHAQALVKVSIETDHGPWVAALVAAGYEVYAINPMSVAVAGSGTQPPGRSPMRPTRTCWPRPSGWTTTVGWPCSNGRSAHCADQQAHAPTTSSSATRTSATKPPSASSPTGSSASSTAA